MLFQYPLYKKFCLALLTVNISACSSFNMETSQVNQRQANLQKKVLIKKAITQKTSSSEQLRISQDDVPIVNLMG